LPHKRSAYKELRKAKNRHFKNISLSSELNTLTKKFEKLVADKKSAEAKEFLKKLISKIDKAASKGILHKNAASRRAGRLTKMVLSTSKT
jgi:small subunit ribosomal protein S20